MKKLTMVAALAMCATVLTASAQVYSQNAVGYVKITVPADGGLTMVGINFEKDDNTNKKLSEIFTDIVPYGGDVNTGGLRGGGSALLADTIYLWIPDGNGSGAYASYWYNTTTSAWVASAGAPADPELPSGSACFIKGPAFPATTPANPVFLHGQVSASPTATLTMGRGLTMVSNPYPVPLDFSETDWSTVPNTTGGGSALIADIAYTWDDALQEFITHTLLNFTWSPSAPVVAPGKSAFYNANNLDLGGLGGFGKDDILWTIPKPYIYP